jgi:hypothetical protein
LNHISETNKEKKEKKKEREETIKMSVKNKINWNEIKVK